MIVLGLDLETTGLDKDTDEIIEIAGVMWHTDQRTFSDIYSKVIFHGTDLAVSDKVKKLCGFDYHAVLENGVLETDALVEIGRMIEASTAVVGHNIKKFDWPFLKAKYQKHGIYMPEKTIIDTLTDLPDEAYASGGSRKLGHLCADHNFLNQFAHRALFDVIATLKLMCMYDVDEVAKNAVAPQVCLKFHLKWKDVDPRRDYVKSRRFRWLGAPHRIWYKIMRKELMEEEVKLCGENDCTAVQVTDPGEKQAIWKQENS